jgi:hypothetical protein
MTNRHRIQLWGLLALPLAAACSDRSLTLPPAEPLPVPPGMQVMQCTVNVAERRMSCVEAPTGGPRAAKILGGQDKYVKLASFGTSYDGGSQILQSNVTVQNLLQQNIGTVDGNAVTGVDVFFMALAVTSGPGSVDLANEDGTGTFTASNQPYFHYNEIISPYQISAAKNWQFQITGTVETFSFTVAVNAPVANEGATLLDKVWDGETSTNFQLGSNWDGGVAPDSASTVSIPSDSLLVSPNMPVLTANAFLTNLRVGYQSTLGLAGFTATAYGNVDAVGTISGGTLRVAGSGVVVGGNLSATEVTGNAALQRSTTASGAVSVTGSLTVKDQVLNISIP